MTVFLDIRSASSRVRPPPSCIPQAARRKVCAFQQLVLFLRLPPSPSPSPSVSPKLGSEKTTPQHNPSCSTQESRLYRTKNTVISARSSVTGPPRSSAPLHLHPLRAALRCTVLHSKF